MAEAPRSSPLVERLSPVSPGKPCSQQDILAELRRVILAGEAPPGTAIPLDAVAKFFVVSPIPVRESLKTLIGEGLVDHEPRGGYRVAELTRDELAEFYVIREVLEAAALRSAVVRATRHDDLAAREVLDVLAQSMAAHDHRAYHRESRRFHLALLAPSRMRRLLHVFEMAWNITEPAQPMSAVDEVEWMHADHTAMLEAFTDRDAEALVSHSQEHYQRLERAVGDA
ncbi:MAG TPA: GntR family transcriptional regulator [Nocardioidaceae bacterium]|nr:GntR family transcriptional regulator [Nocardioidaceae bacterium]